MVQKWEHANIQAREHTFLLTGNTGWFRLKKSNEMQQCADARERQMENLNMFYFVIYWTQNVKNYFIFLM